MDFGVFHNELVSSKKNSSDSQFDYHISVLSKSSLRTGSTCFYSQARCCQCLKIKQYLENLIHLLSSCWTM